MRRFWGSHVPAHIVLADASAFSRIEVVVAVGVILSGSTFRWISAGLLLLGANLALRSFF
jgi:hypothetical protein